MYSIGANGKRISYGIKHYNLDTEADMAKLPAASLVMGCTCFIIESSKHFMYNGDKKWVEIQPFGSSSNTSSDDEIIYEGGTPGDSASEDNDDEVIYEGGWI